MSKNQRPSALLKLTLTDGHPYKLLKTEFRYPPDAPVKIAQPGLKRPNGFQWTSTIQALCLLFIDYVLKTQTGTEPKEYAFYGPDPSPALSINDLLRASAVGQSVGNIFGQGSGLLASGLHEILNGTASPRTLKGVPAEVRVNSNKLSPEHIEIWVGNTNRVTSAEELQSIYESIEETWWSRPEVRKAKVEGNPFWRQRGQGKAKPQDVGRKGASVKPDEQTGIGEPNSLVQRPPRIEAEAVESIPSNQLKEYLTVRLTQLYKVRSAEIEEDAQAAIATRFFKEPLDLLIDIFAQSDEKFPRWAQGKLAAAICSNPESHHQLAFRIANSRRQVLTDWLKVCAEAFPELTMLVFLHLLAVLYAEAHPEMKPKRRDVLYTLLRMLEINPCIEEWAMEHLAGYYLARSGAELEWLVENGRKEDVDEFIGLLRRCHIPFDDGKWSFPVETGPE